ncbi:ATP-binding protein [Rhodohalobacter sp.]|uniref:ATP-binding protein n=1 Tax=Rhodohalobacter sp. TaxID=1974210 RepID=UPI002ACE4BB0|nr:ATP-binding protein [Rhodohalobacter sp.]MDZ7758502.1 ATP-binding protein [Rhodohalobacter sp.]
MADFTFRTSLKSTHDEATKVPDFVSDIQDKASLSDDETSTFMLLLSEAVDNAIEHGNQYDANKNVSVDIVISKSEIVAKVTDEGKGFDTEVSTSRNPLDEENLLNTGGRGIFIIKELSDSLEFLNNGSTLQFKISRES